MPALYDQSGTTNIDLFVLAEKNNVKLNHIVYKNELPLLRYKPNLSVIINMSNSGHPGTHWVALKTFNNMVVYGDSFGVEPPIEVMQFARNRPIIYSDYQTENTDSTNCGQLALFTLGLSQGKVIKSLLDSK